MRIQTSKNITFLFILFLYKLFIPASPYESQLFSKCDIQNSYTYFLYCFDVRTFHQFRVSIYISHQFLPCLASLCAALRCQQNNQNINLLHLTCIQFQIFAQLCILRTNLCLHFSPTTSCD